MVKFRRSNYKDHLGPSTQTVFGMINFEDCFKFY